MRIAIVIQAKVVHFGSKVDTHYLTHLG